MTKVELNFKTREWHTYSHTLIPFTFLHIESTVQYTIADSRNIIRTVVTWGLLLLRLKYLSLVARGSALSPSFYPFLHHLQ